MNASSQVSQWCLSLHCTPPISSREPVASSPGFVSLRPWNQLPRFSGVRLTHLPVSPSVGAEDLRVPRRVGADTQLLRKGVSLNCPPPLTQAGKQHEQYGERDFQQSGIVCPRKPGAMLPRRWEGGYLNDFSLYQCE